MRLTRRRLSALLLALAGGAASGRDAFAQRLAAGDDFTLFWIAFQEAVRTNNVEAVAEIARFPLAVNGVNDGDEVREITEGGFAEAFSHWLEQNSGLSLQPETLREAVLHMDPAAILRHGPNRRTTGRAVRFSSFYFERGRDGWRLTRIYEER